jgi:hypothetical protein
MVRPHHFRPNPETAGDNAFQQAGGSEDARNDEVLAYDEATSLARGLEISGVQVHLFDDEDPKRPDGVFPNNWFSTHSDGRVVLYPMFAPNRRLERRADIVAFLRDRYRVTEVVDWSAYEDEEMFLEGTGALVLDHIERVAYCARSKRAHPALFERWCAEFGYEGVLFDAVDAGAVPIYHTNVMMCIGTEFALVGLETVVDAGQRRAIVERLEASGRKVLALSQAQIGEFAGNALELAGKQGLVLALSQRAGESLTREQELVLFESCEVSATMVPTIERSGGSVRCMLAGVHLEPREA